MRDFAGKSRRLSGCGVETAPGAFDFRQDVLTPFDDGGEKGSRAFDLFGDDIGNDQVVRERRPAVFDLVAERDPQVPGNHLGRSNPFPIADDRLLNPFEVNAVVDMTHMVDVLGMDADRVMINLTHHDRRVGVTDINVNIVKR